MRFRFVHSAKLLVLAVICLAGIVFASDKAEASLYTSNMLDPFKNVVMCSSKEKSVNIRLYPTVEAEILAVAEYGDMYPKGEGNYVVKGRDGDPNFWYSVLTDDGTTGYVCIDFFTRGLSVQKYYLEHYPIYGVVTTETDGAPVFRDSSDEAAKVDGVPNDIYLRVTQIDNGRIGFALDEADGFVRFSDIEVAFELPGPTPEELEAMRLEEEAKREESIRNQIVATALAQQGNVGGQPYWSWYGWEFHVSWCACFVSWVEEQHGMISAGAVPRFDLCQRGMLWFRERERWAGRDYIPRPGDIIFFDNFNNDGWSDHVGIVVSCDGTTVTTIEGNTHRDRCDTDTYAVGQRNILGYGIPMY